MGLLFPDDTLSTSYVLLSIVINFFCMLLCLSLWIYFGRNVKHFCGGISYSPICHALCDCCSSVLPTKVEPQLSRTVTATSSEPNCNPSTDKLDVLSVHSNSPSSSDIISHSVQSKSNSATQTVSARKALINPPKSVKITFNIIFSLFFGVSFLVVFLSSDVWGFPEAMFSDFFCEIQLSLYPTLYLIHKTAVYWLFSFRIEYTFNGTDFAFPDHYYRIFRGVAILVLICLLGGTLYTLNPHFLSKRTSDLQYIACTATDLGIFQNPAKHWMMFVIQIMDTTFGVVTVYAFASRLKMVIHSLLVLKAAKVLRENSKMVRDLMEYHGLIKKSTILVAIALLSTWNFMASLMLDLNFQNAFTVVDISINTLCVVLMFKLAALDKIYDGICGVLFSSCCTYDANKFEKTADFSHFSV